MSAMSGSVSGGGGSGATSVSGNDVTRCGGSRPLKPAKKYRPESDGDKQIVRCKRKLDFVAGDGACDVEGGTVQLGRRSGGGARRAAAVARRNERERKRVSLINRTFETLRDQLPASLWGHRNLAKVSKVETLRAAIGYIRTLEELLAADDEDDGVEEDPRLVEMLGSAERLASLAGEDRCLDATQDGSSPTQRLATHCTLHAAADAAVSACERLEHLSRSGPTTTHVDINSATRRLARLTAPTQRSGTQRPFYGTTTHIASSRPLEPSDDDMLLLDINSNLQHLKHVSDDVILQLVGDDFVLDTDDFPATVGS